MENNSELVNKVIFIIKKIEILIMFINKCIML